MALLRKCRSNALGTLVSWGHWRIKKTEKEGPPFGVEVRPLLPLYSLYITSLKYRKFNSLIFVAKYVQLSSSIVGTLRLMACYCATRNVKWRQRRGELLASVGCRFLTCHAFSSSHSRPPGGATPRQSSSPARQGTRRPLQSSTDYSSDQHNTR